MAGAVLCAVDDTPLADEVVRVACRLRQRLGLQLVLAHAVPNPVTVGLATAPYRYPYPPPLTDTKKAGEDLLEAVAERSGGAEGAELRVVVGDPVQTLVALANELTATLIVIGSRGRGALKQAVLGSVSSGVATSAPCPVVVIPPDATVELPVPGAVVCGVDDSTLAREAADVARQLSESLGAPLVLAHVAPADQLPGVSVVPNARAELQAREKRDAELLLAGIAVELRLGTAVERTVGFGDPAGELAEIARAQHAQLVVVGSRRRSAVASAFVGSVSSRLATAAPCPVVLTPPGARDRFSAGAARQNSIGARRDH